MRNLERLNSQLDGLAIPVVTTFSPKGSGAEIHHPTPDNPQGPIFARMLEMDRQNQSIITAGRHSLFGMESLVPHHGGPDQNNNMVYWVAERTQDRKTIVPWNMRDSWKRLAGDGEFLTAVEQRARDEVKDSSGSFFFVFGWSQTNPNPPSNVAPRAIMSQPSAHFHSIGPSSLKYADSEMKLIAGQTPENILEISLFLDFCAEVAGREFEKRFKKWGGRNFASHNHSWTQLGDKVNRQAFGFLTLSDVMRQLVTLQEDLGAIWPKIAPSIAAEYSSDYKFPFEGGAKSLLLLPPCVTASVFIPSPADKALMNLPPEDPYIWVVPFSLVDKKVQVDGHITNRVIR